ncbi:hypothetical protein BH23DEI1_BH23DEI1_18530 [soil metagenome]
MSRVIHVVSVSLGSSRRDVDARIRLLGREVRIVRRGTNGDVQSAARMVAELDGTVDAIGLGGIDLFLSWRGRRYDFRDARRIAAGATRTPVVCGAGLKETLERRAVALLENSVGWQGRRVLMTSATDRAGMAEALVTHGADLRYGDLAFGLGIPTLIRSARAQDVIARTLGPIVTQLPIAWIYDTGSKQDKGDTTTERYARFYAWADVIAGDWHFIRRYAPADLAGKTILTNTTTRDDVAFLARRGAARLVTTTPRFDGRSLSTNLLEAAFIGIRGRLLEHADYEDMLDELDYAPTEAPLGARAASA